MHRFSVCRLLILHHKPTLGHTKPVTGLHAARGLDIADVEQNNGK